jgi:hypothetical protein
MTEVLNDARFIGILLVDCARILHESLEASKLGSLREEL